MHVGEAELPSKTHLTQGERVLDHELSALECDGASFAAMLATVKHLRDTAHDSMRDELDQIAPASVDYPALCPEQLRGSKQMTHEKVSGSYHGRSRRPLSNKDDFEESRSDNAQACMQPASSTQLEELENVGSIANTVHTDAIRKKRSPKRDAPAFQKPSDTVVSRHSLELKSLRKKRDMQAESSAKPQKSDALSLLEMRCRRLERQMAQEALLKVV